MQIPNNIVIKCRIRTANGDICGILLDNNLFTDGITYGLVMTETGKLVEYDIKDITIDNPEILMAMNHSYNNDKIINNLK